MRRLKFQTGAIASQAPAPPSFSGARKTCARSERKGLRPIAQILLKLTHCPHSLAATLAALPSMSLIPFAPFFLRYGNAFSVNEHQSFFRQQTPQVWYDAAITTIDHVLVNSRSHLLRQIGEEVRG